MNPSKALNLSRKFNGLEEIRSGHHQGVQDRKDAAYTELIQSLDEGTMDEAATLTGLYVRQDDVFRIA